jgi:hypothetical protein
MNRKLTDREVLRQAQKDREAREHRVRCLGRRYAECEEKLRASCAAQGLKGTRENFLSLAFEEMAKHNTGPIPELVLDRQAKRSRPDIICWFCENENVIQLNPPEPFTEYGDESAADDAFLLWDLPEPD